ncbi:MAG: hypothetical protein EBR30_01535 [Cytophagia bacterium]|nr:hypothetical protein [Cytophagia bacterium]
MEKKIETLLTLSFIVGILVIVIDQGYTLRKMQADCMIQGGDIARDSIQRELTRYQLALEMLKEEDSVAADKFQTLLYKFE